jgi:hypothetical protein
VPHGVDASELRPRPRAGPMRRRHGLGVACLRGVGSRAEERVGACERGLTREGVLLALVRAEVPAL